MHPQPRVQKKAHALVTTGTPNDPAFPAQWLYGLCRALPGVPGFVATVARTFVTSKLDPSVGGSGPRVFAVRIDAARPATPMRPSHPAPNVRDDREPPL